MPPLRMHTPLASDQVVHHLLHPDEEFIPRRSRVTKEDLVLAESRKKGRTG